MKMTRRFSFIPVLAAAAALLAAAILFAGLGAGCRIASAPTAPQAVVLSAEPHLPLPNID
ncbi:hypothetical protein INF35_02650 [Subdoligranulum sp. DSM 109015]|uniref:Uncharacterized protein n=1 Tax=Gemmiger gallinarum TaxID=2779354 RepID=A0ABR9R0Q4_9FIRM|nr:hypothetical protein [Gemmiger gallinarum]MBE5036690.1 hypothetical protein [Gemmiger gallinarum]